jgi:hypothetical protein
MNMEKLKRLMEVFPDEVNEVIDNLYKTKFPKNKSKKTMFPFKVLGKEYTKSVFTKNYIEFISDVSKIHPYKMFQHSVLKNYISQTNEGMKQSHKINDSFYVTSYTSTGIKIRHIKELCGFLGLRLEEL